VIDFNSAVIGNAEGKVAYGKFQEAVGEKQKGLAEKQKSLQAIQDKLRTQDKTLSDDAKANYNKQVDLINTDLTRMNEDAQRDLGEMQQQLFAPIAGRVRSVMEGYAKEMGFALVFDTSTQNSNMVYWDPVADITTEVIRRVDADAAKNPTRPAPAGAPGRAPGTAAPARGATPPATRPAPSAPKAPPQ
jgi:Skp family chaperone for outer membrane proteins